MPRYYFDLSNGHRVRDYSGLDCRSEDDAKHKAKMIAHDIAREVESIPKRRLTVVDEDGRDVFEARITKEDTAERKD